MQFYSINPLDVLEMDADFAQTLWLAIDEIEAQQVLLKLKIADFPHMNSEERGRLHREIYDKAYPRVEKHSITLEELARLQRGK